MRLVDLPTRSAPLGQTPRANVPIGRTPLDWTHLVIAWEDMGLVMSPGREPYWRLTEKGELAVANGFYTL